MASTSGKIQTIGVALSSILMLISTSSIVAFLVNSLMRHL